MESPRVPIHGYSESYYGDSTLVGDSMDSIGGGGPVEGDCIRAQPTHTQAEKVRSVSS